MAMSFSLAHLTVLGCAPPEATYIAARTGYDYISLRILMMGLTTEVGNYALVENKSMLRKTKAALRETGLQVHDIELARIHENVDVTSYEPAFAVAAELGTRHLICSVWTPDRELALERFVELCDLAQLYELTVNLEFVTWAEVANLERALELARAAQRSNVGVLIDTLHFHRSRVRLDELDGVPPEWCNFVHLCDAPAELPKDTESLIFTGRENRLYVGEGGIDIASILNRLPEIPYSVELPNSARVREVGYEEHARRCLESAKTYFAKHPHIRPSVQASGASAAI